LYKDKKKRKEKEVSNNPSSKGEESFENLLALPFF